MKNLRIISIAATAALAALFTVPSAGAVEPTPFTTHPSIAAQPYVGQSIDDMAVKDGKLYMSYGDYNHNTGPIDVAWADLNTGATGVDLAAAPTEEIGVYRSIGGELYAPWFDPTACGNCNPPSGGFTTSAGGWKNVNVFPAAHVYDIAKYGNDWFLAGASAYEVDGAVIYRSTDGGKTWSLSLSEESTGGNLGYERFYWMGQAGGKLYAQASGKDFDGSTAFNPNTHMFQMKVWDGTRWAKASDRASIGYITLSNEVESFDGNIYSTKYISNGKSRAFIGYPFGQSSSGAVISGISDFFQTADRLYVVHGDGRVAYTTGVKRLGTPTWTSAGTVPVPAGETVRSIAVANGYAYVGTAIGNVYRAPVN